MSGEISLLCYNKGCGQRFDPTNNTDDSCIYHPGVPVFHDAYKGWSCCNKKTTDFTDFLNIKGCSKSFHNNEKPLEPEKKSLNHVDVPQDSVEYSSPSKPKPIVRPSDVVPYQRLKHSITSSLKAEISKLSVKTVNVDNEKLVNTTVTPGTLCKNGGCAKAYGSEVDNSETCMYHPGFPVFHEGMKFWTCCMRRTTDFDSFLEQVGCTTGNHLWIKLKSATDCKLSCRYDWYQTGPYVFISIYAKIPLPDECIVEGNQVKVHAYVVFGEERDIFDIELLLFGVVDLQNSSVQYAANKVEIKLKKAEALYWSNLALPVSKVSKTSTESLEENLDDSLRISSS